MYDKYSKYSIAQKTNFWIIVTNVFLVIFTFGLGLLIQDYMVRETAKLDKTLSRYSFGEKLVKLCDQIYSVGKGSDVLFAASKIVDNKAKSDNIFKDLYKEYKNNPSLYLNNSADSIVKVLGHIRYYFPEMKDSIDKYNTELLIVTATLKTINDLSNYTDSAKIKYLSVSERVLADPALWFYAGGIEERISNSIIREGTASLDCYFDSLKCSTLFNKEACDDLEKNIPNANKLLVNPYRERIIEKEESSIFKTYMTTYINLLKIFSEFVSEVDNSPQPETPVDFVLSSKWIVFMLSVIICFFIILSLVYKLFSLNSSEIGCQEKVEPLRPIMIKSKDSYIYHNKGDYFQDISYPEKYNSTFNYDSKSSKRKV